MSNFSFSQAQADMRHGYICGAPGVLVSCLVWLIAGTVAYGMHVLRLEWFFPAVLLLIGGRYLTFQSVYGVRMYWLLGAVLCVLGVGLALLRVPVPVSAFAGGAVEVVFSGLLFRHARRAAFLEP